MIEKPKFSVLAIAAVAVAVLLIYAAVSLFTSPPLGEEAPEGSEAFNVPNASQTAVTPAPEPATDEDELLFVSKRGYINEIGCPTVIGEVRNDGESGMTDILLTASFYCSSGKLIGAKDDISAVTTSYTAIPILAPNETSPFKIALSIEELSRLENFDVDNIEKFKVVGEYSTTDEELYTRFEIPHSAGEFDLDNDQYYVTGTVKNIGNETAEQVTVVGTFYDDQTRIIEVLQMSLADSLAPGEENQFEITVPDETIAYRIETYQIQAAGS
jgi:hypothetical protein